MENGRTSQPLRDNNVFISETFRKFLLPTILSLFGGTICNFSSGIIVGNVMGARGLAAMGIVTPVFFIFTTLGSLLGVGGATLASIRVGRDDMQGVNRLFSLSLFLIVLIGFLASAVGMLAMEPLLTILGAQGETRQLAREYCRYFLPGAWTTMLLYIPLNFFRITGKPSMGAWMFGIMAVFNISLSLLFMIPLKMGIKGVALGTVLGTAAALLFSLKGFFSKDSTLRLCSFKSELKTIPSLMATGSPMALTNLLTVLRTVFFNRLLMAALGMGGVSVFALLSNVNTFALAILSGVAQTLAPLTGVFFGERDTRSARRVMSVAARWGLMLAAVFAVLLVLLWKPVCLMFGLNDPELFSSARLALVLFGISMLPAMLNNLYQFHYMTIRIVWLANLISICRCFLLPLLIAALLAVASPVAVWGGFPLGELLTIPVLLICARLYSKKHGLSLVLLLDDRDMKNGRALAFSVLNSVDAVMEASEKISEFCAQNELDPKRTMLISLSLEELLLSVSDHAFNDGDMGSMDVRLFVTDEDVILRIRNGGRQFDPIRFFENNPENIDECLGIQMIVNGARSVKYTRALGVNNLTVLI